ncbi:uncharacterized protein [Vulpes vulpes]|uniref:Uncharacterized protein n=1 Tax=Vulpes vulpes TaxID=9627 RepID=A0ABM4YLW3_VULVU
MEAWAGEGAGPGGRALRGGGDCTGKVRRRGPRGASSGRPRAPSRGPAAAEAEAEAEAAAAAAAAAQRSAPRGAGAKRRGPGVRGGRAWSPAAPRAGCRLGAPGTGPAPRAVARRPEALAPASRSSRGPHSFTAPTAGAAACLSWPVRLPRHGPRLLPSRLSDNNSTYSVPSGGPSSSPVANSCGLQQVDDVGDNFFPVLQIGKVKTKELMSFSTLAGGQTSLFSLHGEAEHCSVNYAPAPRCLGSLWTHFIYIELSPCLQPRVTSTQQAGSSL